MVQPLFTPGYLENPSRTDADMQTAFEQINAQIENSFASSVLSGFTGYSSTGLSVTFSLTAGTYLVAVVNGLQWFVPAGDSRLTHTVTASQDTYVDVSDVSSSLTFTWTGVANGATPPALAAGALRIALVVSGATSISAVHFFSVPTALAFPLGGGGNCNPAPTSGGLAGEYWQASSWSTTGSISSTGVKLHVIGDVFLNNPIAANSEIPGGQSQFATGTGWGLGGTTGQGLAGGVTGQSSLGGGGGANGGSGGHGGSANSTDFILGALALPYPILLTGSGGGGGGAGITPGDTGASGGAGGGGVYIEASGNIYVLSTISALGSNGANTATSGYGGGGGGSGGCIELRAGGQIFLSSSSALSAVGGNGGNSTGGTAGGGGGGGGGGFIRLRAAYVNTTLAASSVQGGSAGTGSSAKPAAAGASGVIDQQNIIWGPRSAS